MTDDRDDEGSGVPLRRDAGSDVTESGRHVTNRNVVPRSAVRDSESDVRPLPTSAEPFDDVTPVLAPPLDAPRGESFEVVTPVQPVAPAARDSFPPLAEDDDVASEDEGVSRAAEAIARAAPAIAPAAPAAVAPTPPGLPLSRRTPTGFLPGMQMPRAASEGRMPYARAGAESPPDPKAASDSSSPAPRAASDSSSPAPRAASESSSPAPRAASDSSSPAPRAASESSSPAPRAASESSSPAPRAASESAAAHGHADGRAESPRPRADRAPSEAQRADSPRPRAASQIDGGRADSPRPRAASQMDGGRADSPRPRAASQMDGGRAESPRPRAGSQIDGGRAESPRPRAERAASEAADRERRDPTERGRRGERAASEAADRERREPTERSRRGRARAPAALDRALRVVTIVAVFGLGAAGLAQPTSVLRGAVAWLAFLVFVLAGWGTIVVRAARTADADVGQRAALGIAGYLAFAGPLLALGILTRPAVLFLICIGFAGFAWREATEPAALWHRVRDGLLYMRGNPALGTLVALLVAFACVRVVAGVALLDRNPWDDDLAYTPLLKRLLDTGDLVEPFSFRRLGAYGGQTVLQALGAARGSLANVHLIDRGLGFGLVLLLTVGYARDRRTQPVWLALIAVTLLLLPGAAINTASYWTGVVGFFALYRCLVREQWALVGLTGAAICTLRQNFLVPVVALVVLVLLGRLAALARTMPAREAWHQDRIAWLRAAAVATAAIVPWWIAALRASHTFLFPIFDGTWNHDLSITPAVVTFSDELQFLVTCGLDTAPLAVLPILAVVLAFVSDRRLGRPLGALTLASLLGFALLAHTLVGSEAYHLWRYAFGFVAVLVIVLVLELGADDERTTLAPLGRWIVLAAFVLQIAVGRGPLVKQVVASFGDLREAAAIDRQGDPSARAEQRRYSAMQAALPVGARAVVMLDDPALLDFRRNAIANLDTPGFASPGSQLPMFAGAEPLRAYLVAQGYRYAAFVRSERSRYFFRRVFWIQRMFTDVELFQAMSAYTIDAIDSFAELATTTPRLYDADGLVVLDLAHPTRAATTRVLHGDEPTRRAAWVRALADREGVHDAWSLTSRADLRFEDGVGGLRFTDDRIDDPQWFELGHARAEATVRGQAILPVQRRVHLRVRGTSAMRLRLRGAIALNTVFTHPRLDVSLDGELLGSSVADATGRYAIDVVVPRERLADGWRDVYLVFSSIADPTTDVHDLRIARLESVEWAPP